jgi:hypothetical protein
MRKFFMDRVRMDPLLDGQNYIYMHYADMIANGYHRMVPCPFQTQGIMLNPNGDLFFCENSDVVGNVRAEDPAEIYFRASSQAHRDQIKNEKCPTCLSPCQMNVSAVKQVVPTSASCSARRKKSGAATGSSPSGRSLARLARVRGGARRGDPRGGACGRPNPPPMSRSQDPPHVRRRGVRLARHHRVPAHRNGSVGSHRRRRRVSRLGAASA